jgi:hypothetical protein
VTREQVEAKQEKAVLFARNVLQDDDLADDLESESADDYAARKHLTISNPRRVTTMASGGNGGNGDDDYDFSGWTKADCTDALTHIAQIAGDAYDPMSSREDLAQALSDILDELSDDDGGDDDDAVDDEDLDDDDAA